MHSGGVLLISRPSFLFGEDASGSDTLSGVTAALASSCSAAGAFVSIKSIGNDEKAITTTMWFHGISFTVAMIPLLFGLPTPAVVPTAHEALLLSQVVWTSFLGQLMLSRGFQLLNPSVAAAINLSQVVHARTLSVLFLNDTLPWTGVVGSILIGGGVLSTQLGKQAKKDVACETGEGGEEAVLLTERPGDDEKSLSPVGGGLHVLNTSPSFAKPEGLEMPLAETESPCFVNDLDSDDGVR